jgi:hypothetical protein
MVFSARLAGQNSNFRQTQCPTGVSRLLDYIVESSHAATIVLQEELTHVQLIPLIGVLLEYPVAYVPARVEQTIFLTGVPLDIYECKLSRIDDGTEIGALMKFSCPVEAANSAPWLNPSCLRQRLIDRIQDRLDRYDDRCKLAISHNTQTLDRVAL